MKIEVPFFWQYAPEISESWRHRACTMTSLAMVLNFFGTKISPQEVIDQGLSIKAYIEGVGWDHRATSMIAHNHGVHAYSQEFRTLTEGVPSKFDADFLSTGISKIEKSLSANIPVLASIKMDFKDMDEPHTIVLVGMTDTDFIYHDSKYEDGAYKQVSKETFKNFWRKFAVFFEK